MVRTRPDTLNRAAFRSRPVNRPILSPAEWLGTPADRPVPGRSPDDGLPAWYTHPGADFRRQTNGAHVIRVVVVDDEALIRVGFQRILDTANDIDVVAAVPGGQAVRTVRELCPDVVLLDIRMPDVDGITVLAEIRQLAHPPAVAMLTTFDTDEYVATALRSGAAGFLLKDTDPEQLPYLIRALAEGGTVLSSKVTRTMVDRYLDTGTREADAHAVARLTERELAVLLLITEGLPNSDIGERLYISTGTVKGHVSAILTKLQVSSRVQAALLAERAGLLRPPWDGKQR
jgi:DNA-binding NarL/FixJ family response regulator